MRFFGSDRNREIFEHAKKLGLLEDEIVYLEKHKDAESLRDLWDKEVKGVPLIVHRIRYYLKFKGIVSVSDLSKEFEVTEREVLGFLDSYLKKKGGDFFVSSGWVLPLSEEKVLSVIVKLDDLFKQLCKEKVSHSDLMHLVELLVSLKQYALKIDNSLLLELCENKLREIKLRLQEVSREEFHSLLEDLYGHFNHFQLLEEELRSLLNSEQEVSFTEIIESLVVLFEKAMEISKAYRDVERRLTYELETLTRQSSTLEINNLTSSLLRIQGEQQAINTQYTSIASGIVESVLERLKRLLSIETKALRDQKKRIDHVIQLDPSLEEIEALIKKDEELFSRYELLNPQITGLLGNIRKILEGLDFIELLQEIARLKALLTDYQSQYQELQVIHSKLGHYQEKYSLIQQIHSLSGHGKWEEVMPLTRRLLNNPLLSATEKQEWQKFLVQVNNNKSFISNNKLQPHLRQKNDKKVNKAKHEQESEKKQDKMLFEKSDSLAAKRMQLLRELAKLKELSESTNNKK